LHSIERIKTQLQERFPEIGLLESNGQAERRFEVNSTIVFTKGEDRILKFYSYAGNTKNEIERERASFFSEYNILKKFSQDDHVINVYELRELLKDGSSLGLYMELERVPFTLRDIINKKKHFSESEVYDFLIQMDVALSTIHNSAGHTVIHSDIKPSNIGIQVKPDGGHHYKLMDFGVSVSSDMQVTSGRTTTIQGLTPAYAAPEQLSAYDSSSGQITSKADVYAVGVIALEMLTGASPRKDGESVHFQLPFFAAPDHWKQLFLQLCHDQASRRSGQIQQALASLKLEKPNEAKPPPKARPIRSRLSSPTITDVNPRIVMGVAAAGVLLIILSGVIGFFTTGSMSVGSFGGVNDQIRPLEGMTGDQSNEQTIIDDRGRSNLDGESDLVIGLDGYSETRSGLLYKMIHMGRGITPGPGDRVEFHYTLYSLGGERLGSSRDEGRPYVMSIYRIQNDISGLAEGLQMMNEGAIYEFRIPPYLASVFDREMIMEVELIEVK
jgi:serine/threonine protein kinase